MQRIILKDDIHSLSEFRSNASGYISQVHSTKRPLVITQNGKSSQNQMPVFWELCECGVSTGRVIDGQMALIF